MPDALPLVFSITSGKGGVGKTNLAVNLAVNLADLGKRVVLLDADLGLANVDVILGLTPEFNLFHLFQKGMSLRKVLYKTPYGFSILPATSGVSEMLSLSTGQKLDLLESMDYLESRIDYLIVDTGAGVNDNVIYFNLAARERILVLTTEPTSLTDSYTLVKIMHMHHAVNKFRVIVNMTSSEAEAKQVFRKLYAACDHFLDGISLDFVGFVPKDTMMRQAVMKQIPISRLAPQSPASQQLLEIARCITHWDVDPHLDGNIKFFWKKLLFQEHTLA